MGKSHHQCRTVCQSFLSDTPVPQCHRVSTKPKDAVVPQLVTRVGHFQTCSEVFFKRMNFPSTSISSMDTFPVAEAEWEMVTLLLASDSSTLILFLLPPAVRTLRLDEARETVTREEGLGDSFSLEWGREKTHTHTSHHRKGGSGRDLFAVHDSLAGELSELGIGLCLQGTQDREETTQAAPGMLYTGYQEEFLHGKSSHALPREVVESPSPEVLETHVDMALGDTV